MRVSHARFITSSLSGDECVSGRKLSTDGALLLASPTSRISSPLQLWKQVKLIVITYNCEDCSSAEAFPQVHDDRVSFGYRSANVITWHAHHCLLPDRSDQWFKMLLVSSLQLSCILGKFLHKDTVCQL